LLRAVALTAVFVGPVAEPEEEARSVEAVLVLGPVTGGVHRWRTRFLFSDRRLQIEETGARRRGRDTFAAVVLEMC